MRRPLKAAAPRTRALLITNLPRFAVRKNIRPGLQRATPETILMDMDKEWSGLRAPRNDMRV
jgi:hypothetical protein